MVERAAFARAKREIVSSHETRSSLCAPVIDALPIDGASVSVLAGPASRSSVCTSDSTAGRLDEMQFDLGEGPCWTALSLHSPVLRPTIQTSSAAEWPAFSEALRNDAMTRQIGSVFAFPLVAGSFEIGALDLYTLAPSSLAPALVAEASTLAGLTAWQVLRRILDDHAEYFDANAIGFARREVHQATGMLIVQLQVAAADAELLLRAHAFSSGRTVGDIANDVVERRLDFTPQDPQTPTQGAARA